MIDAISGAIESGKGKGVFDQFSINNESWLNKDMYPPHKAIRHNQFNEYVEREVVPYIKSQTSRRHTDHYLRCVTGRSSLPRISVLPHVQTYH